ncbi:MAG: hypothetical protein AMXMBFR33_11460 [Candidatus Xenobia bacterium]
MKAVILTAASLPAERLRSICERLSLTDLSLLTLDELRHMGWRKSLRRLRALRSPLYLYVETDSQSASQALSSLLRVVALCSGTRRVAELTRELDCQSVSRWQLATSAIRLALESIGGWLSLLRSLAESLFLLSLPRHRPRRREPGAPVGYLRPSLSLGLKAGGSLAHTVGVINAFGELGIPVQLYTSEPLPLLKHPVQSELLSMPSGFGFPPELNLFRLEHRAHAQLCASPSPGRCGFLYQRLSLCNLLGIKLARALQKPLVLEYNGSESWIRRVWSRKSSLLGLVDLMERVNLRHADLIVTPSRVLAEELQARGVEPERIVMHPNGVDPELYAPRPVSGLRERLGLAPETLVAGYLGTFGPWHGVEVLAEAIATLHDDPRWQSLRSVHFLLIGEGLGLPRVRQLLEDVPNCTLTGLVPQAEAGDYLALCDILLSPHVPNPDGSRFFGSPTKLFEYMATGKAILASDLEQLGEVLQPALRVGQPVTNDAVAVLCEPGSVNSLLKGLELLVLHPELRGRLGLAARQAVLARYTWRHHVAAILEALP